MCVLMWEKATLSEDFCVQMKLKNYWLMYLCTWISETTPFYLHKKAWVLFQEAGTEGEESYVQGNFSVDNHEDSEGLLHADDVM